jgi:hypothetical protein
MSAGAVVLASALWQASPSVSGIALAQTAQASTTTTTAPGETTTQPDPDLGRRLGVHPPDSAGAVVQGGPLWMGAAMSLAAGAGIAFALVRRRPGGKSWPLRRRTTDYS